MKSLVLVLHLSLAKALALHAAPMPTLEPRGQATQLIVDGQPWLIRGGEIANSASSRPTRRSQCQHRDTYGSGISNSALFAAFPYS